MSSQAPCAVRVASFAKLRRHLLACGLVTGAALLLPLPAAAADAWPSRTISLINPYAAGGPADALARTLGLQLEKRLGRTVIVLDKPGGAATIGTGFVARAKPDGYTLLISTSAGHVVTPLMQKVGFDGIADFDFLGVVAAQPNVLVATPSLGVKSVADLVELNKRKPGTLNFASAGMGGATHLGGEIFQQRSGVKMTHVPFSGAAPAIQDLLGGQVGVGVLNLGAVLPYVRTGQLKALAYASRQRSPLIPDVPTMAEAGVPSAESLTWYTLSVPRGTPAPVEQKLQAALEATLSDPVFIQFLTAQGAERMVLSPAATTAFVRQDKTSMAALLQSIGLPAP